MELQPSIGLMIWTWAVILIGLGVVVYIFIKTKERSSRFQIILFSAMCFAITHARSQHHLDNVLKSAGDPNDNILTISYLIGALICLVGIIVIELKRMKI